MPSRCRFRSRRSAAFPSGFLTLFPVQVRPSLGNGYRTRRIQYGNTEAFSFLEILDIQGIIEQW